VTAPEVAVLSGDFTSGGGFSNFFARPSYQDDAVKSYFGKNAPAIIPSKKLYNASGRGFPDVSANGLNTVVIYEGQQTESGGTSASAPIFASIINLINEERLKANKSPVGFLNPTLYQHPEVFNDVSSPPPLLLFHYASEYRVTITNLCDTLDHERIQPGMY
jgi:tripeptidyl-peptidase-1